MKKNFKLYKDTNYTLNQNQSQALTKKVSIASTIFFLTLGFSFSSIPQMNIEARNLSYEKGLELESNKRYFYVNNAEEFQDFFDLPEQSVEDVYTSLENNNNIEPIYKEKLKTALDSLLSDKKTSDYEILSQNLKLLEGIVVEPIENFSQKNGVITIASFNSVNHTLRFSDYGVNDASVWEHEVSHMSNNIFMEKKIGISTYNYIYQFKKGDLGTSVSEGLTSIRSGTVPNYPLESGFCDILNKALDETKSLATDELFLTENIDKLISRLAKVYGTEEDAQSLINRMDKITVERYVATNQEIADVYAEATSYLLAKYYKMAQSSSSGILDYAAFLNCVDAEALYYASTFLTEEQQNLYKEAYGVQKLKWEVKALEDIEQKYGKQQKILIDYNINNAFYNLYPAEWIYITKYKENGAYTYTINKDDFLREYLGSSFKGNSDKISLESYLQFLKEEGFYHNDVREIEGTIYEKIDESILKEEWVEYYKLSQKEQNHHYQ